MAQRSELISGNHGIGTTDPLINLHICDDKDGAINAASIFIKNHDSNGNGGTSALFLMRAQSNKWAIVNDVNGNGTDNLTIWGAGGLEALTVIAGSGNVGIGTTNPGYRLQVGETSNYGYVDSTGAWQTGSDINFKENIGTLEKSLEKVVALRGVEYNDIGDDPVEDKTIGFIAQEVEEVIPEIVSTGDNGLKGIAYAKLTPILVEAIKAQQEMIDELKAEIDELKAK